MTVPPITAIVLAGSRPGADPLLTGTGIATKALFPVAGQPMLAHVMATLTAHPAIGRIIILAQQPDMLIAHPALSWIAAAGDVELVASMAGISRSIGALVDARGTWPLLLTTADNVLLDAAMIDGFVAGAAGSDIAVAMVERRVLVTRYPGNRRTWLKFRGGAWSGANLFWLGSAKARAVIALWEEVERDRKRGWKILATFGPLLLAGAALRILSIHRAVTLAGRRFGLEARVVPMAQAEACIDADKPGDVTLIEAILAGQESGG